jgi:hypothetical protein
MNYSHTISDEESDSVPEFDPYGGLVPELDNIDWDPEINNKTRPRTGRYSIEWYIALFGKYYFEMECETLPDCITHTYKPFPQTLLSLRDIQELERKVGYKVGYVK